MAGVAGLEPTHAGFRDPCLTNLAIPLCFHALALSTINIIAGELLTVKNFFNFFKSFFVVDFFDFPYLVYKLYQIFFKMSRSFFGGDCMLFNIQSLFHFLVLSETMCKDYCFN